MGLRLLVATYYYPPQPGSGSNRWAAMVKYLRNLGHHVTVVTAAPPGHPSGEADGAIHTGNLNSSRALRHLLLREQPTGQGQSSPAGEVQPVGNRVMPPVLWKGIVPDPWLVTWVPYALRAIRRELQRQHIDCLITSSPAESTHLLGLALGRRRPAWIADFRDGWCFEPLKPPFPTAAQRELNSRMEARVGGSAEVVVGVTKPIVEDFQARLGIAARLITNGFDPDLAVDQHAGAVGKKAHFTLVHTGALRGQGGRDPRPLLAALRKLIDSDRSLADRVRLVLAGRSEEDERSLLRESGLGDTIEHLGFLSRDQAIELQRSASALLLLTSRDGSEATGKLYEYMAARRPIVALAQGNEAARIVAETHTGACAAPDDVGGIESLLCAAIRGELERSYEPLGVERYAYPVLAEQLSEAVRLAVELRAKSSQS
ncbi:MAG: glycosyltransferase [Solirubrobacteraceae bacterium]